MAMSAPASLILVISLWAVAPETPLSTIPEPRAALTPETEDLATLRRAKVARARESTMVLLHREAWDYAPENTLSAIRAGFNLEADQNVIQIALPNEVDPMVR